MDLVEPIEADSAITASVFRLANSAAMGNVEEVTDLNNAIARIGMKATSNLAVAQSVFNMFDSKGETFGFDRTAYWVHSLGTACCGRALAPWLKGVDQEDAFLAGLLHDIGKMILDEYLPTEYQKVVKQGNLDNAPVVLAEKKLLDLDHSYVGNRIAQMWDLPEQFTQAIRDHHKHEKLLGAPGTDDQERDAGLDISRCVSLADQLAKAFGLGHSGDCLVAEELVQLWRTLSSMEIDLAAVYARVRNDLSSFLELLRVSSEDLRLASAEQDSQRVLLWFPEKEPPYRVPIDAFFTRMGCTTAAFTSLEESPGGGERFDIAVTSVSGSLDDVSQAADTLGEKASAGLIFTDCPEVERDGLSLNGTFTAMNRQLDFYTLKERFDAMLAACGADS